MTFYSGGMWWRGAVMVALGVADGGAKGGGG